MIALVFAVASAAAWGAGDFCGGLAARRLPVLALALRAHLGGLAILLVVQFVFVQGPAGDVRVVVWGALAGLAGGAGLGLFYGALAVGTMSVVAPISGVSAAVVPVVFGLLAGERPAAVAFVGLGLAFGAIALVGADGPDVHLPDLAPTPVADAQVADRSGPDGPGPPTPEPPIARGRAHWRQVVTAAAAGGGFGLFAVFIDRAGGDAGLWPLIWGRVATVCAFWVLSRIWHQRVRTDRPTRGLVGLTALLDASANALYLAAVNRGFLAIVGAIVALYPATTVLLARVVLHERLARNQRLGLVVAAAAVTLVAFG